MKRIDAKELVGQKLTVCDLMRVMDDIDVYDDVCEELGVAFCNPFDDDEVHDWGEYLTEEGMKQFAEVLDYPMEIYPFNLKSFQHDYGMDMTCAVIGIDGEEGVWQKKLRNAKRFFFACAGYIDRDEYDKWFLI